MRQLLDPRSVDRFFDESGSPLATATLGKNIGGITVLEPSPENK